MEPISQPKKGMSSMTGILIALLAAIIAGAAVWAYYVYKVIPDLNATPTVISPVYSKPYSPVATTISTANWKTYTNTKYGFTLTFTDKWQGYKVKGETAGTSALATYRIFVPTSSKTFSSEMPGYADPFVISIYKKTTYDNLKTDPNIPFDLNYGTKLADNGTYVATVAYWQDSPTDLQTSGLDKEVTTVAKSFQFTK
jgi:hypothetical protein